MGTTVDGMTWTFGVSEVTTLPWSFEQDVERYAALGVEAIEIWENKLAADSARRRRQLALPAANSLRVSSFQARVRALFPTRSQPEPAGVESRMRAFVAALEASAPSVPGCAFVLNTGIAPGGEVARAHAQTVDAYGSLARRAEQLGVRIAIEPLHPLAMNEDSFVWNLEEAIEIVDAVAHPALGICADSWNLAGQFDLQRRLARCGNRIVLAQVSDWRRPRSFLDRLAVGDGSLDFAPFAAGLREAGYDGPVVLEIFSQNVGDSLYRGDLDAVIRRSRRSLDRIFAAAT